ncbi:MAG: RidA family protein [Gammaproteobacteria bacterium]
MPREIISTADAPQAIGPYSQAVKIDNTVYLSGQIPLLPDSMELLQGDIRREICQVFDNLAAVAKASGASLENIVKLTIYLLDLQHFQIVNEVMAEYFQEPYPARAAIGVAQLPKDARIEMDAVLVIQD